MFPSNLFVVFECVWISVHYLEDISKGKNGEDVENKPNNPFVKHYREDSAMTIRGSMGRKGALLYTDGQFCLPVISPNEVGQSSNRFVLKDFGTVSLKLYTLTLPEKR